MKGYKHKYRYTLMDYLTAIAGWFICMAFNSAVAFKGGLEDPALGLTVCSIISTILVAVREWCKFDVLSRWLSDGECE